MSPAYVIKANLARDTTSSTAAAVAALNTTTFPGGASEVPDYAWKCLSDIWVGAGNSSTFAARIVPMIGTGTTNSQGSIVIMCQAVVDSVEADFGSHVDIPGSESTIVDIHFYGPRNHTDDDIIQAELRTRSLLDYDLRQRFGSFGDLYTRDPSTNAKLDKSITDDYFKMHWITYKFEERGNLLTSRYRVEYVRVFARR